MSGEITTSTYVDIEQIVRSKIQEIGYNNPNYGFDGNGFRLCL
ncbi:S-adenosylmethionine synthetase, N-terminal domain protein [Rickettsia rhipicephali str. Ect]|uniref:S-adenosylmethionine synthetase, N-terminal domain protein n=2 Tax=spotted fever group TaxID=114277 RepID=A0A0F3PGU4_RICRH|nr:S-adenosylmethionine synthetase [Rickettsia massiliae str. AZT80]KJV79121.1 S-adenosylmethionine synthetase, N-terminal domain protein [Rickettsia rhipicephali str. Ect]